MLEGRAPAPVYLAIRDGDVDIHDASYLWGCSTGDADAAISAAEGPRVRVMAIGQAGEKLVRYANRIAEARFAGGCSGMGGVMGAKDRKAIAVRGSRVPSLARTAELDALRLRLVADLAGNASVQALARYGTGNNL